MPFAMLTHSLHQNELNNNTQGRWIDILFHIGWSTGSDGLTEAWLAGQKLTPEGESACVYWLLTSGVI
jgi:hypothetical protein